MEHFLKKVPLFADLGDEDLAELAARVELVHLAAGEFLFKEGARGDLAYVIKEGELEIIKAAPDRDLLLAVRGPGEVIGELALLEGKPRMASVRARKDSVLLAIGKEQLDHLLCHRPSGASTLFYTVLARWRDTEALLRQSEKMAQLGVLTAGVAHELNNPAAAVQRGADQLRPAMEQFAEMEATVRRLDLTADQQRELERLTEQIRRVAPQPPALDTLERSDWEATVEEWLIDNGIDDGWKIAPTLVDLGLTVEAMAGLSDQFGPYLPLVCHWLHATYRSYNLLSEVDQGAERIASIVKALKAYSFLDRGPFQTVNIHEGLDNTLLILRHKLRSGITVRREYAADLPLIQGYGGELNQVWTNLIDNAIDALDGKGEITLRTRREGSWVVVEVVDNGPGIPEEIQGQLFTPFFTTKPPGAGTGLGLDISYKIIVHKHRGDIKLFSRPGETRFQVRLPLNFESP